MDKFAWRVAIDPGATGALVAYNLNTTQLVIIDTPTIKVPLVAPKGKQKFRSEYVPRDLNEVMQMFSYAKGAIEDVSQSMTFNFKGDKGGAMQRGSGQLIGYGMWLFAAAMNEIDLTRYTPTSWKSFIMYGRGGQKAEKSEYVEVARQLWPDAAKLLMSSYDGRSAAALILHYHLLGDRKRFEIEASRGRKTRTEIPMEPLRCKPLFIADLKQMRIEL